HVAFEDLGTLASLLRHRGFKPRYLDVGVDRLERAQIEDSDILVVLGGPIGVYEEDKYPFLRREVTLIFRPSRRLACKPWMMSWRPPHGESAWIKGCAGASKGNWVGPCRIDGGRANKPFASRPRRSCSSLAR